MGKGQMSINEFGVGEERGETNVFPLTTVMGQVSILFTCLRNRCLSLPISKAEGRVMSANDWGADQTTLSNFYMGLHRLAPRP